MHGGWSNAEALFIAGFSQAEGHFAIVEQNAGQSLSCVFSLRLRDDDTDLVGWLQDVTGLGSIRPIPAVRTSAPQSEWRIARRSDLRQLADLLTDHPMHGRKAAEFASWARAVSAWNEDPPDRSVMRAQREELLRRRAYAEPPPRVDITLPPQEDLRHYLGGFVSGDGHFSLSGGRSSMTLKQRRDELPLLREICRTVGLGAVYEDPSGRHNPCAMWIVSGTRPCQTLAGLLDGTIRGKKASEFELWAATVDEMALNRATALKVGRAGDAALKTMRCYRPPRGRLRRVPAASTLPQDSLRALQAFAAERDGPLDALTYMSLRAERHPDWPARNTVARHFGSWYAALEAAGIADRSAAGPDRYRDRSRAILDERRAEQRERVLASVRRFVDEFGHVPRAMEYFRWRLECDPDTPTQATVYNLFPGGWNAVRAALVC